MSRVVPRRTAPVVAAVCALMAGGGVSTAGAQAPSPGTVTAVGQGVALVTPQDRTSDASIVKAVADAQAEALPLAVTAARSRAERLAAATGLRLGALTAISDAAQAPWFYGGFGSEGTFGPGRYCGTVGRYRTRRLASGRISRTRIGSRRTCRVPSRVATSVTVTFTTTA